MALTRHLRVRVCACCSKVVRKSIARVLTVVNQTTRAKLREEVANKVRRGDSAARRQGLAAGGRCCSHAGNEWQAEALLRREGAGGGCH